MAASSKRPTISSRLIAAGLVAHLVSSAGSAQTRINDATGRTIEVPATVERIYAAGPPASVLLLAVAPEKLIAWTRAPRPDEAAFLPDQLVALPELGRLTGRGNTANVEVVMAAKPDLILDVGSTAATFVTLAQRVQEQTGVPYLLFDGSLRDTPRLLREVGGAVGKSQAAEALAMEADRQIREVTTRVAGIPEPERPRVYFARGPTGLTTAPQGSMQAEVLVLAGGYNVIAPPPAFEGNLVNVSLEDVLLARPEIIIASDPAFAAEARNSPGWKDVPAVRNGRVYVVPGVPFGWFDSPPSLNRLLGMHWLARVFYPKLFPEPLGPKIKAFHSQYYHREPTDGQVRALLATAGIAE
jgi:iron complex transport system substrate-binding protein